MKETHSPDWGGKRPGQEKSQTRKRNEVRKTDPFILLMKRTSCYKFISKNFARKNARLVFEQMLRGDNSEGGI